MQLPAKGRSADEVYEELKGLRKDDLKWRSGKIFAYVFHPGEEVEKLQKKAYMEYVHENGLDPTSFPSLVKMETDVVRTVAGLLRGDDEVVGNFTSGGTESIILAVKSARDKMLSEKPDIKVPEMVLCKTAHPAFHKACKYLGLKKVVTDFDPNTFKADVSKMEEAINENTVMLVASAPSYAHGVVDPVPEIGQLAIKHGLMFHVDACMGGIMLSIMREMNGFDIPDFDYSVPGVTSMSADMHKFGYSLKGASTVTYRNRDIRQHSIFANASTTSYALMNSTILSSKSGGPIAGAWAMINHLGREGYEKIFSDVMDSTKKLIDGINASDDLRVIGNPIMCIFSFTSDTINVFQLADAMAKKGWYLQPQFSSASAPAGLHLTVNYNNVPFVDEFLKDLPAAVEEVKNGDKKLDLAMIRTQVEGMIQSFGDDAVNQLRAMAGISGDDVPEDMALVSSMLDALPSEVCEALLSDFMNNLFV